MIPLVNLVRQYERLKPQIDERVQAVNASGRLVNGPFVERFEDEFAAFCEVGHAAGTASGTAALQLALIACGVGPGDQVVTTPATFVATIAAIVQAGATPVLADIATGSPGLDAEALRRAITPKTKAVVPVHLYGHACDMDAISEVAAEAGLKIVEDCSQAHGARWRGRRVGGFGDAAAFSLYPGKNLGGLGDGGVVTTNDARLADRIRRLRNWAQDEDFLHREPAFNARLDAVHAAVLSVKLPYLDTASARRRTLAARYGEGLDGTGLVLPTAPEGSESVWHVFNVRHPRRDEIRRRLAENGVQTGVHYVAPIHRQPAYAALGEERSFPNAEALFQDTFSLPICPDLSDDEQRRVIDALRTILT